MDTCAFCGAPTQKNYFNACDECYESAAKDPEVFIQRQMMLEPKHECKPGCEHDTRDYDVETKDEII